MKNVIFMGRHSRYDTSLEVGKGGKLTEQGKNEATEKIIQYMMSIFTPEELMNTRFLIVASQTRWKDINNLGQRAVETADIYRSTIISYLMEHCGLKFEEAYGHFVKKFDNLAEIMAEDIREPNYWVKAPEYIKELERVCGGRNEAFWDALARVGDEIKVYGQDVDTASEIAARMQHAFISAVDWGLKHKDSNTCVIMVSHGETLQPFYNTMHYDWAQSGYNEGVMLEIVEEDGKHKSYVHDASHQNAKIQIDLGRSLGEEGK